MRWLLLTDAPPLPQGGIGNFTISWNLVQILKPHLAGVLTHQYSRRIDRHSVASAISAPVWFHFDACRLPFLLRVAPLLRALLDALGGIISLPTLHKSIRSADPQRILALIGAEGMYIVTAWAASRIFHLPLDLYLVDDLCASATLRRRALSARFYTALQRWLLPHADRVFVISEGFREHLKATLNVDASVLPLPLPDQTIHYQHPQPAGPRYLGFSGSLNELYTDALVLIANAASELNTRSPQQPIRIRLAGSPPSQQFLDELTDPNIIEYCGSLSRSELADWLSGNWVNLLPYSFKSNVAVLVSTSFSSKLGEYLSAGRPILVFGPATSSTVRHFRAANLPLVCSDPSEILASLESTDECDNAALINHYDRLRVEFHSPSAIRARLSLT